VLALALVATPAHANVPDPSKSQPPTRYIDLEGRNGSLPDDCSDGRCADWVITVRDFANNAIPGSTVVIDFSACPDVQMSCDQMNSVTGQTYLGGKKVVLTTNAFGQVTFKVQGAGKATVPGTSGTHAGVACAQVYADGISISGLYVSTYDVNGANGVDAGDLAILSKESARGFLGDPTYARDDLNHSGTVNGADVSRESAMVLDAQAGTGTTTTGVYCP
jgi:hypothetical protein